MTERVWEGSELMAQHDTAVAIRAQGRSVGMKIAPESCECHRAESVEKRP